MTARLDLTVDDLAALMPGEPPYRARQVWRGLHQGRDPEALTELPAALRARLAADLPPALFLLRRSESDAGQTVKCQTVKCQTVKCQTVKCQTVKWLWGLADGAAVETVLMRYPDRATVCVSSQAGCAMACSFCATGQAGFTRHLTAGEIVEQVVRARQEGKVTNLVFMGMGEPLANYEATWAAVERLHDELGFGARHLTVSTVGVVPGIRRLAGERLPVNLAVSLHAANDGLRDTLVPLNRRYPLRELMDACDTYLTAKGRRLSFEWALIDGVNDRPSDAGELAALATPLDAHVNLIPLNPTPGYASRGTPPHRVRAFRDRLRAAGVNATVRRNRGTDIDAACGQLAAVATTHVSPVPARLSRRGEQTPLL